MNNDEKTQMLKGLGNIPPGSRMLQISTPIAWLLYIETSPIHCYYITVDKGKQ